MKNFRNIGLIMIVFLALIITGMSEGKHKVFHEGNTGEPTGDVTLKVASAEGPGKYLVDDDGQSLYLFTADTKGKSSCYDACADAWPPVITEGEPKAGEGALAAHIGTTKRKDGQLQVTYNGWPLYYYIKDDGPKARSGQDIKSFGGEWYLVTPEGEKNHGEKHGR